MKSSRITILITTILSLGLFTGCPSAPEETTTTTPSSEGQTPDQSAAPAPAPEEGETATITLTGNDSMRFDKTEFSVKAGQPVTIIFKNVGTMPKVAMGHNVVVLEKGVDAIGYANDSARHASSDYRDPQREEDVIAATRILGPGEEESISFTAPAEAGDHDYLCTFPGHAQAGMVGVMTVE